MIDLEKLICNLLTFLKEARSSYTLYSHSALPTSSNISLSKKRAYTLNNGHTLENELFLTLQKNNIVNDKTHFSKLNTYLKKTLGRGTLGNTPLQQDPILYHQLITLLVLASL